MLYALIRKQENIVAYFQCSGNMNTIWDWGKRENYRERGEGQQLETT